MTSRKPLHFYKYQGTGNDFILLVHRQESIDKNDTKLIQLLCDRKFGIGADGLILLENDKLSDFKMVYFNADGNQSTMCGNGGRCIVAFAKRLGIIKDACCFSAVDGLHEATISDHMVSLQMTDVNHIDLKEKYAFLNTGSPHHVQLVADVNELDIVNEGAKLRYGLYGKTGSNINFVTQNSEDNFSVRTYERGVEDETLSCGTGVTAVALAMYHSKKTSFKKVSIKTKGGTLTVSFEINDDGYHNIMLQGPAAFVFKGNFKR